MKKQLERIEAKLLTVENAIEAVMTGNYKNGILMLQLLDRKQAILEKTHKKIKKLCNYTLTH